MKLGAVSVEGGNEFVDRWPGIGRGRERKVPQPSVATHHCVGTELANVVVVSL